MDNRLIEQLWKEHMSTAFPQGCRGKDVNGVDLVMLDADVAGCVVTFLSRGNLNLFQTAIIGLCYRNLTYSIPMLSEDGKAYCRLELLAELVLKAVAASSRNKHESG